MAKYKAKNPLYKRNNIYSKKIHEYEKPPKLYRGYQIYQYNFAQWDVVVDGVIVASMAGPNGAERWVDQKIEREEISYE